MYYGMQGRTLQDCTRLVLASVGEGPEMEKRRDKGGFEVKKHGEVERKWDKLV